MSSWTEDRVALLTKLWGEGKTAAEIATELGGVTRNAVIGKAHRLKLSGRVSPIQQNNKKPAKRVAAPVAKKPEAPKKADIIQDNKKRIPLIDIKGNMCRWPIGDPQEQNFGFCGDHAISGLPYCNEHAKAAYQAATRNRLMKEERLHDDVASTKSGKSKKAASK